MDTGGALPGPQAIPVGALRLTERTARLAFTREVSPTLGACELTHLERRPIDIARARRQHQTYEEALARLGCEVHRLPPLPELPDAVFVEDTAVVLDELAVIARPGAPTRRAEVPSSAAALAGVRTLVRLDEPDTLDGGDVLRLGRDIWVGRSGRTNGDAIATLWRLLAPLGYRITPVEVRGCLHLKSAVTAIADGSVLVNPEWVDPDIFSGLDVIEVDAREPFGANALRLGSTLLYPSAFPLTRRRLQDRGLHVVTVDVSELAKAEGAVTCCSLIVENRGVPPAPEETGLEE